MTQSKILKLAGVTEAMSTVEDGNMSFVLASVAEGRRNRETFLGKLGINPKSCVFLKSGDADSILEVDAKDSGRGMENYDDVVKGDALVTSSRGVALMMAPADCLPIILFDPINDVLAMGHGGWKNTDARLAIKLVNYLVDKFDSNPDNLIAYLGPGIKAATFTFPDPLQRQLEGWAAYLKPHANGEVSIDLFGFNHDQLVDAGVLLEHIEHSEVDTGADKDFYSHYRAVRNHESEGRNAVVCMIGPQS